MSFDDDDTTEAHERRIVRCAACQARIIFLLTSSGKKMPVDADTVDEEDEVYEHGKHVNHWGTCPNADQFRKRR